MTLASAPPTLRVGIVTLGCDKNTVDNEYLAGLLEKSGCEIVLRPDGLPLDAVVVTTCGFIGDARQQSIDVIREMAERKRTEGSPRRLYVAGCLSQKIGDELMREVPEIDGLVGVGQFARIASMVAAGAGGDAREIDVAPKPVVDIHERMARKPLRSAPHSFLKIADGCNHACSFCAIPAMKGKLRSVDPEILLDEARGLLERGAKELCLVAQDLSEYGLDRDKDRRLPWLLRELNALPGDFWIRCLYFYPGNVTDEFLSAMAECPKVVPYLEMPLQHLHPGVLRRMKRPFHERNTFETIERIRAAVPGVTIRSTVIVGFPGETTAEFNFLLEGLQKIRFDRLGAFEYSPETGTPAGEAGDQVPAKTKAQRWRMVMRQQAAIAEEASQARVGSRLRALVEGFDERSGLWVARSEAEAPEVDGKTLLKTERKLAPGLFVEARVIGATAYDVYAEPLNEAAMEAANN